MIRLSSVLIEPRRRHRGRLDRIGAGVLVALAVILVAGLAANLVQAVMP